MSRRDRRELLIPGGEAAERDYIRRAFELAYFIHPNVGVALRITEAALCKLPHTFGKQDRRYHYVPAARPQGRDRTSHVVRTKVSLRKEHLLQLLVCAESDLWERSTEHGDSPYRVTIEDMVIRFIKHLVQITLKRNSFYVTLGVSRLLYNYQTSQVSQIYDILMQDPVRFRENAYLRKQKKLLMHELTERFGHMIRMVKAAHGEYRFVTQPTSEPLISLVNECLRRYTPWGTTCVVPATLDPAESIEALFSKGANPNEESSAEMNRIHTILHPDCFPRLVASLGFELPEGRLAVPQFFFSDNNESRGDRFNPPPLTADDQRQIRRARDDSARHRKAYSVGQLRIYIDNVESLSFDPRLMAKASFEFGPQASVLEVRGEDPEGELPLATLFVSYENIAGEGSLRDSVVLEGGQRITILLTPIRDADGQTTELNAEISYAETKPLRTIAWMAQRAWLELLEKVRGTGRFPQEFQPRYSMIVKIGFAALVILSGAIIVGIIWRPLHPAQNNLPAAQQAELTPTPAGEPSPIIPTSPTPVAPQTEKESPSLIARATWNKDPEAVTHAVLIQFRRGDIPSVEVPFKQTTLAIALNRSDAEDQKYDRYRIVLIAGEKAIWLRTLRPPRVNASTDAHVLNLELSPQRFPKTDSYTLQVEGETKVGWQSMGQVILRMVRR